MACNYPKTNVFLETNRNKSKEECDEFKIRAKTHAARGTATGIDIHFGCCFSFRFWLLDACVCVHVVISESDLTSIVLFCDTQPCAVV